MWAIEIAMLFLVLVSETVTTVLDSDKALSIILSSVLQKLVLFSYEHQSALCNEN